MIDLSYHWRHFWRRLNPGARGLVVLAGAFMLALIVIGVAF